MITSLENEMTVFCNNLNGKHHNKYGYQADASKNMDSKLVLHFSNLASTINMLPRTSYDVLSHRPQDVKPFN